MTPERRWRSIYQRLLRPLPEDAVLGPGRQEPDP